MKNRKPYNISAIIQFYNIFQVTACVYFVTKFCELGFSFRNTWKCVDDLSPGREDETFNRMWWFLMLRILELVETVFFILRKKQSQTSALHIYHHISTIVLLWLYFKYSAGKFEISVQINSIQENCLLGMMELFIVVINSCVHIVMYTFYFCSSVKSLSPVARIFKPLLTFAQLVQLVLILRHCFVAISPGCEATKLFYLQIPNICFLIFLFAKFFIHAYTRPSKTHVN